MTEIKAVFTLLLWLGRTFPKVFSRLFALVPAIGAWLQFLPYFLKYGQVIAKSIDKGAKKRQIQATLKTGERILAREYLTASEAAQASRELDELFGA